MLQNRPEIPVNRRMKYMFLGQSTVPSEVVSTFGGKAQKLHELKAAGFPVPGGLVLNGFLDISQDAIDEIGGFPVAVRSSGSLEDLGNASFAGQYETFLNVSGLEELRKKVLECFESRNSQRVKDYLTTRSISWTPESLKMSVLIQRMVESRIAGVLFTLNPLTGREEEMYVEFCEGLGERLVSGHVTPTRLVYNWFEGQKVSEDINSEGTVISDHHLKELIDLSSRIQAFYGCPQDIEWAIGTDNKLYILQSRPVTSYSVRSDRPELTNADFKDGGISARVCTPMMYSAYREALKYSMGDYFKKIQLLSNDEAIQWIYYHYGRVYWNAEAVKEGLKKIPDYKEEDFDRDLGLQKDYGPQGPYRTPISVSTVIHAVPVLVALNKEYIDCLNMVSHFRTRFEYQDSVLKENLKDLPKMNDLEFSAWFYKVILFQNETEKNYFRTIYNNSNFQSEFKSFLKKLPAYQTGDEVDLMAELHGVSHLDVQSGLEKLSKVADFYGYFSQTYYSGREDFLKIHYHHGPAELDITVPRWGEKKEWVDELVKNYVPTSRMTNSKFETTYNRISKNINFFSRRKFSKLTEKSRHFLRIREEMRSFSTRAYYLLRIGLLEFAKRNSISSEDIFMFDILEVKKKLAHPGTKLPDTSIRKRYYQGYKHFKAPNDFGGTIKARKDSYTDKGLSGLGCSPGVMTGKARVITDIHQTGNLCKEDILVTLFTDPGWTPVLARVGGVVTEVGGLLSHAAVIGREYGIPAVLNLIDATKIINDGDIIRIDGKTGKVEILEKGPDRKSVVCGN